MNNSEYDSPDNADQHILNSQSDQATLTEDPSRPSQHRKAAMDLIKKAYDPQLLQTPQELPNRMDVFNPKYSSKKAHQYQHYRVNSMIPPQM